ncbi:hypothetical protein HYV21_01660 [Candidatus Microgenomates bacterium]|nr:hypothetical protein [Candidatus Microgenomates bacterium]
MEIEAEKTVQQIEAGNRPRARLPKTMLGVLGLLAISVACTPRESSSSSTPEATPTPIVEIAPAIPVTITTEAQAASEKPAPEEQKIHTFMQEVLKPEVYNPVGLPKLLYRGKSTDGTEFLYQYRWDMGEWKGIQLNVQGTYSESIKGEKYSEGGLPLRISIRITESQKRVDRLIPSEMNQIVAEYFTLPTTITASSWQRRFLPKFVRPPLETLWDNPDGTKEGRVSVVFGNISSDGFGNYYLGAEKIFKDFPGYNEGTLIQSSPQ